MCYKTVVDVDDCCGDRTPACREFSHHRVDSNSILFAAIRERTIIEPVLQGHIFKFLRNYGIEILMPSTTTKDQNSWVVMCRGNNRFVDELLDEIQDTISRVKNHFWKDPLQKKVNLVLQSWSNPASKKLVRRSSKFRRIQCTTFLEISKFVMRLVRRYDQDEIESDGATHWNSTWPKLRNAFLKYGG